MGSAVNVVLAGGGTGGHVIPAIAIAEEVVRRGGSARFVGTQGRLEEKLVPKAGFGIDFIDSKPLAGGGIWGVSKGLLSTPFSVAQSMKLLLKIKPQVVMGVGGYVAGPVVMAAKLLGMPTAVLEQNATVGLTNKILAKVVTRAFVSFEITKSAFPRRVAVLTGNPVGSAIVEARKQKRVQDELQRIRILVMGGSQGALAIDERVPAACKLADWGDRISIVHQCRTNGEQAVIKAYEEAGISAKVSSFIDDTATAYLNSDLVVCRSGATTVSEISAMGLPAIFLPYPHHQDRQQEKNTEPMVAVGAAVMLDEKETGPADMVKAMSAFINDDSRRKAATKAALELGRPQAAKDIVDNLVLMTGGIV